MLLITARINTDHRFKHTVLKNKQHLTKHWKSESEEGKKRTLRLSSEEKRKVRKMGKGFTDNIEGVKSLALVAKEWEKNDQANDGCIGML